MLACIINISEGRDRSLIAAIAARAGASCIDVHSDPWHNRSVVTLAGEGTYEAALEVARATVELCDYLGHDGVHPSIGSLDVVPFVPLGPSGFGDAIDLSEAVARRDAFIAEVSKELALPCFSYGPERTLPEIRRRAFVDLLPDAGPLTPHPTAGASCVGARPTLIAFNVYLVNRDLETARAVARAIRSPEIRALGLAIGAEVQVSCNLVVPWKAGPAEVLDAVAAYTAVTHTELVGLVPDAVLHAVPRARWAECDLSADRTFEARLEAVASS